MNLPCPISHNRPQVEFELKIYSGISKIKRIGEPTKQVGGGIRSNVSAFTKSSRKRFLEKMAGCRNMDSGYFGTFTYPGNFTYNSVEVKLHLAAFRKRIFRLLPEARIIWRMEILPRQTGASMGDFVPHYHILIFGIPYGRETYLGNVLGYMWNAIVNNFSDEVSMVRSGVEQIRSRKHAIYYASKYAAKVSDYSDSEFGRHWGFWGQWDESDSGRHILNQQAVTQIKRLFRSYFRAKGKRGLARMMAGIREDFGCSMFLGDNDDLTGATCSMIDFIIAAERAAK